MNNAALLRMLIVYSICVPLAIAVGYLVTNPMDYSTLGIFGIVALLLVSPLLLRWHHPLLILSWNLGVSVFFVKGAPNLWFVMVPLSLGISVLDRTLNSERHFIRVPQLTWPLLCLAGVVLMTAKFTGGIGLRLFGSDVYGGQKYILLFLGILGYFALTARRIPPERAGFYLALFYLSGLAAMIGNLSFFVPSWAGFIYWFFPNTGYAFSDFKLGETRLGGFSWAGTMLWYFLMARYGIRGIFLSGKPGRLVLFTLSILMIFLGGYRGQLLTIGSIFIFQFFLEGMHRSKLMPLFAWAGIMATVAIVPLASKLPFTFQRTLAFLPLNLDPNAREAAQATSDWRLNMWKALLPQIPPHLLLGKGLAIAPEDYNEMMGQNALAATTGQFDPSQTSLALSYDYHSGPLSVIIPFGLWGAIAFLWFLVAGLRVLYCNYRYGDPALQTINTFLFVYFLVTTITFMIVFGALSSDLAKFTSLLGLSVAFNGGVCQPAPRPVPAKAAFQSPRSALRGSRTRPAFPR